MHLDAKEECSKVSGTLLLRVYTPSPPSSAPLSNEFYNKSNVASTAGSVPSIPGNFRGLHRMKDLRLPVKSLQVKRNLNVPIEPGEQGNKEEREKEGKSVLEIKDRTRKMFKRHKDGTKEIYRYTKSHRRHKYSSTESMTTSSSGGSMESLQSSTSEGNFHVSKISVTFVTQKFIF